MNGKRMILVWMHILNIKMCHDWSSFFFRNVSEIFLEQCTVNEHILNVDAGL